MRLAVRRFLLLVVGLVIVGGVAWLGSRAYVLASLLPSNPGDYISLMTLAVTVVGILAAGMGLGGSYLAWRVGGRAAEAIDTAERLQKDLERKAEVMGSYDALIDCVFGSWRPTGMLLAEALKSLQVDIQFELGAPQVAKELNRILSDLRQHIARTAVLGAHAVQLFVSVEPHMVVSSAQALAASGRREAFDLLSRRIDIEARKEHPDGKIIRSLAQLSALFSA